MCIVGHCFIICHGGSCFFTRPGGSYVNILVAVHIHVFSIFFHVHGGLGFLTGSWCFHVHGGSCGFHVFM